MGHGLKENDNLVLVREPAWHGLGVVVQGALTAAQALEMSGLGRWTVSKEPIYTGDMKQIPGFARTVRSDDGTTLGVVGDDYEIIQNDEAFDLAEAIIGTQGEAQWDVAGSLYGGQRVWLTMKLNKDLYIGGDIIETYFLLTTGHDGRHGAKALTTPIRTVCQNTMNMALQGSRNTFSIRHTKNYEEKIAEAKKTLGLVKKYYETFEQFATRMVEAKFAKAEFDKMLDSLLMKDADGENKEGRALVFAERTRSDVMAAYMAPDIDHVRETKWGALNAIADYSDHGRSTKDTQGATERAFIRTFEDYSLKGLALRYIAPEFAAKPAKGHHGFGDKFGVN